MLVFLGWSFREQWWLIYMGSEWYFPSLKALCTSRLTLGMWILLWTAAILGHKHPSLCPTSLWNPLLSLGVKRSLFLVIFVEWETPCYFSSKSGSIKPSPTIPIICDIGRSWVSKILIDFFQLTHTQNGERELEWKFESEVLVFTCSKKLPRWFLFDTTLNPPRTAL